MPSVNEQQVEDGVFEEIEGPCAALVPVAPVVYRATKFAITRPDASFIAHLIASTERLPQTREVRRADPADVLSAYRFFEKNIRGSRVPTRQTA